MAWALDTAALCAVLGAVTGLGVPSLIARIPEPVPPSVPEPRPRPEPARVAAEGAGEQPSRPESPVAAAESAGALPKEPYTAIAARPGLMWKAALASGAAAALVGLAVGWHWQLLPMLPLVPIGVALAVVDWRTRLLPTRVVAPTYVLVGGLAVLAGALVGDWPDLVRALWGLALARGLFWLLWLVYPRGMGFGDVRLAGVLGLALGLLGWGQLVIGVYAGFVLGGVGGLLLAAARLVQRRAYPFGPFMLLGALLGVLGGQTLTDYYLGRL